MSRLRFILGGTIVGLLVAVLVHHALGPPPPIADAGPRDGAPPADGGRPDAGPQDATQQPDSRPRDARPLDGPLLDARPSPKDVQVRDAGVADAKKKRVCRGAARPGGEDGQWMLHGGKARRLIEDATVHLASGATCRVQAGGRSPAVCLDLSFPPHPRDGPTTWRSKGCR